MKITHVVGARPNFMKVAPVLAALGSRPGIEQCLVHTGQHYDANMSEIFFKQLGMPQPDINLEVGSGTQSAQTAQIMIRFEDTVGRSRPDIVLVYGDVNSTVAAALVCAKLGIRLAHVEAGLRSYDRSMPEEINRLVTDQIADVLLTPSEDGNRNLEKEGIPLDRVFLVGNVMIDTLVRLLPQARAAMPPVEVGADYVLVTLHRPSNVDDPEMLGRIVSALGEISCSTPVIFPVHPRTRQRLSSAPGMDNPTRRWPSLRLVEPLGYLEFLRLQTTARLVITDSGGIQEETTYLGIPCLTVRENTERPVTVILGTNLLVGRDIDLLKVEARKVLEGKGKQGSIPPLWDGRAGERIADVLLQG
jgi:UDP-N-acetylglucosamine 2-epimerase (non-hydrolysing)